jgi:hypothetical protein
MSGSGGGGGSGGGDEPFNCERLVERTSLSSPVPEVVASLKENDFLQVQLGRQGEAEILQAVDLSGNIAGSLVPPSLPRFIGCIRQGSSYIAVIQEKIGGRIRVEIRPGVA